MARRIPSLALAAVLAVGPLLAGCGSMDDFDLDKLDVFGLNKKKPLPGERRELFPGGVPGVTQGIPPEYLKSNVEKQQAAEAAAAAAAQKEEAAQAAKAAEEAQKKAAAAAAAAEKPKPKPKPKVVRLPDKPATQVTVQPTRAQPAQQAPWPDGNAQPQGQPQQQQSQQQDPAWNAAPPPGTFSR